MRTIFALMIGLTLFGGGGYTFPSKSTIPPQAQARHLSAAHRPVAPTTFQFTSADSVLHFEGGRYWASNGRYALAVEFVEASAVAPQAPFAPGTTTWPAPPLRHIAYPNLWPGISLIYDAPAGAILRSTYTLAPGADPRAIRLRYNVPVTLNADATLRLAFEQGALTESAPMAWQVRAGQKVPVAVQFERHDATTVGFVVGNYDSTQPLWIDPLLQWNTFLGGTGNDRPWGMVVDSSRQRVFVAGQSSNSWGTPVRPYSASVDSFVAQLTITGTVVWNTFLGAVGDDFPGHVALDAAGDVYVTGSSANTWGNPVLPFNNQADTTNAFVAKLTGDTGVLAWNTFLGGSGHDQGIGISLNGTDVFVNGHSLSTWGDPVLPYTNGYDAYVARLTASDGVLVWNTFLGGAGNDRSATNVAANGFVYVNGYSDATWGTPIRTYTAGFDGFAARLNASTGGLSWVTFLGGNGSDFGHALTLSGGDLYMVSYSNITWGTPLQPHHGNYDIYVAKLITTGVLSWHTFLGGTGFDAGVGLVSDTRGNLYVQGYSDAPWGVPLRSHSGSNDGVVARIGPTGQLAWNTFLGGAGQDYGRFLALYDPITTTTADDVLFASGYSTSTWGAPTQPYAGGEEVYLAQVLANPKLFLPLNVRGLSTGLPISQSFTSGVFPPANWSVISSHTNTWVLGSGYGQWDSYSAMVFGDTSGTQDEVLLSPAFIYTVAQLRLSSRGSKTACVDTNMCDLKAWLVVGSGWGGGDDVLLGEVDTSWPSDFTWALSTINLPSAYAGQTVRLAFEYTNTENVSVFLDDITITSY